MLEKVAGPRWETAKFVGSLAGTGAAALGMGSLIANSLQHEKGYNYGKKNSKYKGKSLYTPEQERELKQISWDKRNGPAARITEGIYDKKKPISRFLGGLVGRRSFYSGMGSGSAERLDSKKDRKARQDYYRNLENMDDYFDHNGMEG